MVQTTPRVIIDVSQVGQAANFGEVLKLLPRWGHEKRLSDCQAEMEMEGEEVSMTSPEDSKDGKVKPEEDVSMTFQEDTQDDKVRQGEEVNVTLPEDLEQMILAMVPFPFVLKSRVLSKSWLARFSPISLQGDEMKKDLAISFQKQVAERSFTWKTFCPVFIGKEDMKFMTYDRSSCTWRRIPALSFLPENLLQTFKRSNLQIEGAILFVSFLSRPPKRKKELGDPRSPEYFRPENWSPGEFDFYVANILTQSWKQLPPHSTTDARDLDEQLHLRDARLVSQTLLGTYKVILFYISVGRSRGHCLARIYESKSNAWSSKRFYASEDFSFLSHSAYFDGALYRVVHNNEMAWGLLAFHVEKGAFEVFQMPPVDMEIQSTLVDLVVCNGSLLMVAYNDFYIIESVIVLRIDLMSRRCVEVTRGPPAALNFGKLQNRPASDGDCIFFTSTNLVGGMLAYNLLENKWSCIPCPTVISQSLTQPALAFAAMRAQYKWTISSFQPGLNPFLAV